MTERNIVYKPENTVYQFECKNYLGEMKSLADYTGQVLLIVNTASECGFTPQYGGLEKLHQDFHNRGFSVLGFPCNQFGNQEPGNNDEIQNFCSTKFEVTFPVFAKIDVNGPDAAPLFQFLKKRLPGLLGSKKIKWNFTKFLIGSEGEPIGRFGSRTKPEKIASKINDALTKTWQGPY